MSISMLTGDQEMVARAVNKLFIDMINRMAPSNFLRLVANAGLQSTGHFFGAVLLSPATGSKV